MFLSIMCYMEQNVPPVVTQIPGLQGAEHIGKAASRGFYFFCTAFFTPSTNASIASPPPNGTVPPRT